MDWKSLLSQSIISNNDWITAINKSGSWSICAISEYAKGVPLQGDTNLNVPEDKELQRLGIDFCVAMTRRDAADGLGIIDKIEKRTAIILNK